MIWLIENGTTVLAILFGLHAAASAIAATTDTRKDDDFLGKAYKVLEIFALNIGKAKQQPGAAAKYVSKKHGKTK